jgi:hypothetical protein
MPGSRPKRLSRPGLGCGTGQYPILEVH